MTALRRVVLTCDVVQTVLEERAVQLASRALDLVVSRAGAQTEMLSATLSLQFSLPGRQTELLASLCGGRCGGDTTTLSGLTLPDTLLVRADTYGGLDHAEDLDRLQVLTDFL